MILSLCSYAGHLHHYPLPLPFGRGRGEGEGAVVRCAVRLGGAEYGQGTTPPGCTRSPICGPEARAPRKETFLPSSAIWERKGGRGGCQVCGAVGWGGARSGHNTARLHPLTDMRARGPRSQERDISPFLCHLGEEGGKGRLSGVRCGQVGRSTVRQQHSQVYPPAPICGPEARAPRQIDAKICSSLDNLALICYDDRTRSMRAPSAANRSSIRS
jgi:hypothetical protein